MSVQTCDQWRTTLSRAQGFWHLLVWRIIRLATLMFFGLSKCCLSFCFILLQNSECLLGLHRKSHWAGAFGGQCRLWVLKFCFLFLHWGESAFWFAENKKGGACTGTVGHTLPGEINSRFISVWRRRNTFAATFSKQKLINLHWRTHHWD